MKKLIPLVIILSIFMACKSERKDTDGLLRIPINVEDVTSDAASFLEKIEIVPLETNDSILFSYPSKILYDKETDTYAVMNRMNVFTFTGEGKAIGSSVNKRGQGPDEYTMIVDMKFNHFLGGIDLLSPYGTIYTYSPTFKLLARRSFKPEFPVSYMMPLSVDNYLFSFPYLWTDQEVAFMNISTGNTTYVKYQGMISGGNGLEHQHFHKLGDSFYFIPQGVNYYFYKIDTLEKKVSPAIFLDFGVNEIKEGELPGRASGKRVDNDKDRMDIADEYSVRHNFLRKSDKYVIPMQKFFNEHYVYIYMVKGQESYGRHYIYNRMRDVGYLIKRGEPFCMYPCFAIDGNVLLAVCQPSELPMCVDRKFMAPEEIATMEGIKDEDNSIIIKYHLKR